MLDRIRQAGIAAYNSRAFKEWAQPIASGLAIFAWLPFVAIVAFLCCK